MTWDILPRNADLTRTADPLSRWHHLEVVERHNVGDTWTIRGPADVLGVFTPGMGSILYEDDEFVTSGRVRKIRRVRTADPDTGQVTNGLEVGFVSDLDQLARRLCFPVPSHDLTTTVSTFSASHDVRTGAVETVILGFVAANAGPAAPITRRRVPGLVLPTSLGRGGTTTVKARMDNLGTLVHDLAEAGGLLVDIVHDESTGTPRLLLTIDTAPDVSDDIRFGDVDSLAATAFVTDLEYAIEEPSITDAVIFAAGEEEAREGARFADNAAATLWGVRSEVLIDQRQTDDQDEIERAGANALEDGAGPTVIRFDVVDTGDVQYRREYAIGTRVGVDLPGIDMADIDTTVREVTSTASPDTATTRRTVAIGSPGASANTTKQAQMLSRALRRISTLERGH